MENNEEFGKKHIAEATQKKTEAEIEHFKMKQAERKERLEREYRMYQEEQSGEEEYFSAEEMGKLLAESITPKIAVKDLRRMKERELKKAEYDEEDNKRIESFEEE